VKGRLAKEIISFIPTQQYELFILGKSNIVLINNNADLIKYKAFMEKNMNNMKINFIKGTVRLRCFYFPLYELRLTKKNLR
jgi:hypothetical protein